MADEPQLDLPRRLAALTARFDGLAGELDSAAAELRAGRPPATSLTTEIEACAGEFAALREAVLSVDAPGDRGADGSEISDLVVLAARVEARSAILDAPKALATLDRVRRLVPSSDGSGELLRGVFEAVATLSDGLQRNLSANLHEMRTLLGGGHPLACLLALVETADGLAPEEWESARKSVAEAYGPAVATAACRGRLAITPAMTPIEGPQGTAASLDVPPGAGDAEPALPVTMGVAEGRRTPGPDRPPEPARPMPIEEAVWSCLRAGRAAAAYQIAVAAGPGQPTIPPAPLLEALVLAPHLTRADGAVAEAIGRAFGAVALPPAGEFHLLAFAAVLRPALLVPLSGAAAVAVGLELPKGAPSAARLLSALVDLAEHLQVVDAAALKGVRGQAAWEAEKERFRQKAAAWCEKAQRATLLFAAATDVWRVWCRGGGAIDRLLDPVRRFDASGAERVREQAEALSDRRTVIRCVRETERELDRQGKAGIEARALRHLEQGAGEAVALAREWLGLLDRQPHLDDFMKAQLEEFRRTLLALGPQAQDELGALAAGGATEPLRVAASLARAAVADLADLFDPEKSLPECEVEPRQALGHALLLAADADVGDDWAAEPGQDRLLHHLLETAATPPSWRAAFEARVARRDLSGAERIVEYCAAVGEPDAAGLEAAFRAALEEHRQALGRSLEEARDELELAAAYRLLDDAARDHYAAWLLDLERGLPGIRHFDRRHRQVDELRRDLVDRKSARLEIVRAAVEALNLPEDEPALTSIRAALESGDLLTANEYVERVKAGEPVNARPARARDPFLEFFLAFFPERAREIHEGLERSTEPDALLREALDASSDVGEGAEESAALLRRWFDVKRRRELVKDDVRALARGLGFNPEAVSVERRGALWTARLVVEQVRDRDICAVPLFASLTQGRYQVLGLFGSPSEEEILASVGETAQRASPSIVLYFGRLSERQRRELARLCRERRRSFLVVDDVLMTHLASVEGYRLSTFFSCTLPFTFAEPYVTSAGLLPAEMFYGRRRELNDLMDSSGAPHSFVYGGRQLGKTALLREAERSFHQPRHGRFAFWVDLKAEGLGLDRRPDEIWLSVGRLFRREGIVPADLPDPDPRIRGRVEGFVEAVVGFLRDDPERRVLLLLDEADAFLKADGESQFRESDRLKGLMESTSRHLKVVFAGLHNVLRSTEQANHPLAHLGEPINIGPFLRDREWDEARALIKRPIESLGFRFESEELVTRILAQTNCYPNLIQLYCSQLLQEAHQRALADGSGPPWRITAQDVDRAYRDRELREAIRQRFNLTLQLDPRYEVIAYVIASEFAADGSSAQGIAATTIRAEATDWWSTGFAGLSDLDFTVLLEEMEGLGVLRKLRDGERYTLRNPNLLMLMGQQEDVLNVLYKKRELPAVFEPSSFRARRRDADDPRRHPLTFRQEASLVERGYGVTLAFGVPAAGVDDLADSLAERLPDGYMRRFGGATDTDLEQWLQGGLDRAAGGTTVLAVEPHVPWTAEWVGLAVERLGRLHAETRGLRALFVGGPRHLERCLPALEGLLGQGVRLLSLEPWTDAYLRQWLEDLGLGAEAEHRRRVAAATGRWPSLVVSLHDPKSKVPTLDAQLEVLDRRQRDAGQATSLWPPFGLDSEPQRRALKVMRDYGAGDEAGLPGEDIESIAADAGMATAADMQAVLRWAEILRLVVGVGPGHWRLDPVVARLLGP